MKTIGNEPACPIKEVGVTVTNGGKDFYISGDLSKSDFDTNFGGLTKREYFAAMAMQGLLNSETFNANGYTNGTPSGIAEIAVHQADALIEALNKEG